MGVPVFGAGVVDNDGGRVIAVFSNVYSVPNLVHDVDGSVLPRFGYVAIFRVEACGFAYLFIGSEAVCKDVQSLVVVGFAEYRYGWRT